MNVYKIKEAPKSNQKGELPQIAVLFAKSDSYPQDGRVWETPEDDTFEIELDYVYECIHLYTQDGVKYYGWL